MIGIAVAVIAIKGLIIAGLARAFGNSWPRSVRLGLLLSQAGEFGFVLFAQAAAARLILPEAASLFGAVVTLSMAATPFLMRLTDWLERREEASGDGLDGPEQSPETSVIVVGYGRFGQTAGADADGQAASPVTLIDTEAGDDRGRRGDSAPKSIMATGCASTCCGWRARKLRRRSCSARTIGTAG